VLAAVVEYQGKILLARNAAWPHKMYALITGFMEAGESPQEGIAREVKEETNLDVSAAVADRRLRVPAHEPGDHRVPRGGRWRGALSPELVDYRLYDLAT
jgi:NAD+ diphosphatase